MSATLWNILHKLRLQDSSKLDYALLVLNQPILCQASLVKFLWKNASIRALVDGGANKWLEFVEKESVCDSELPDFISGDFDSILPRVRDYFEERNVTFIHTPNQDETDFTKALKCIAEKLKSEDLKVNDIFVICEMGGRFDQIMANINTLHKCPDYLPPNASVAILSSQSVTWVLPIGKNTILVPEDHVNKKYHCGLIPFCGSTVIETTGLKWNINNEESKFSQMVSTSNTYSSTTVEVACDKRIVWTSEYTESDN